LIVNPLHQPAAITTSPVLKPDKLVAVMSPEKFAPVNSAYPANEWSPQPKAKSQFVALFAVPNQLDAV